MYLSIPTIAFDEYAVYQEIYKLRYLLLCMQHQSRLDNKVKNITFYPAEARYVSDEKKSYSCGNDVVFGFQTGLLGPPSRPTKVLTHAVTFPNATMHSYTDGVLDSGIIYMTNKHKSVTYALTTAVGSESLCRIYQWTNGAWQLLT